MFKKYDVRYLCEARCPVSTDSADEVADSHETKGASN